MAARRPGEEWLSSVGGTRFDEVHGVETSAMPTVFFCAVVDWSHAVTW
jgi:hypothetical protein